jgi:hypothetical protein
MTHLIDKIILEMALIHDQRDAVKGDEESQGHDARHPEEKIHELGRGGK